MSYLSEKAPLVGMDFTIQFNDKITGDYFVTPIRFCIDVCTRTLREHTDTEFEIKSYIFDFDKIETKVIDDYTLRFEASGIDLDDYPEAKDLDPDDSWDWYSGVFAIRVVDKNDPCNKNVPKAIRVESVDFVNRVNLASAATDKFLESINNKLITVTGQPKQ